MAANPHRRFTHLPGSGRELLDALRRIQRGDEAALTQFYRATSRHVYGLALQMLRDHQLAEDATVEVFDRVWRSAERYRVDLGSPLVWLLSIARHLCIDVLRRQRIRVSADDIAALATDLGGREPVPFAVAEAAERARHVREAASQLPRGQREAIAAAFFSGMSQSEIARTLDVPLGTVKARIRKGLAVLRQSLRKFESLES